MMLDIDMQSYAGEQDQAAAGQSDANSYSQEAGDYPVHEELLAQDPEGSAAVSEPEVNPQAEHFRALREEVERIKAEKDSEKKEYQLQLDLLKANVASQRQPQSDPSPRKMFDNMKDDDVPSVSEIRREWEQREYEYQSRLEELQVAQAHPDYAEVLEKYSAPLIREKPYLAQVIQAAPNKAMVAYELGKLAQQARVSQQPAPPSQVAEKIVANARKPGTLSQAGGQSNLSQADYYATMSDNEFLKLASRNMEGI